MAKKKKAAKRYFVLLKGSKEVGVFTGSSPRAAALKAASRDNKDIQLRERGTKKIHIYKGERKKVAAPADRPSWMPAQVWKPNVKKVGIKKLK